MRGTAAPHLGPLKTRRAKVARAIAVPAGARRIGPCRTDRRYREALTAAFTGVSQPRLSGFSPPVVAKNSF
jgi:hypothetical protein